MTTPVAPHRTVRIPRLMRVVRGPDAVMSALGDLIPGSSRLLIVHHGARSATGYGTTMAEHARDAGYVVESCEIATNDEVGVAAVDRAIEASAPDFVLGVGGGRIVDVAKLAAARRGSQVVTIPTQLASDAICSPVAIVLDAAGRRRSVGAQMPAGIVVDMAIAGSAPTTTWLSGLGDLVSNLSAVKDWRLAHAAHGEAFDDFACLTAEAAALLVLDERPDIHEDDFRQRLIRGLILSGLAMEMAGSSRPASGSEHLISHALDVILAQPRQHGLQVALGMIASGVLRGEDVGPLVRFSRAAGLPVVPDDLGISIEEFMAAVRLGPSTRPDRRTPLDEVDDEALDHLRDVYERGAF